MESVVQADLWMGGPCEPLASTAAQMVGEGDAVFPTGAADKWWCVGGVVGFSGVHDPELTRRTCSGALPIGHARAAVYMHMHHPDWYMAALFPASRRLDCLRTRRGAQSGSWRGTASVG